MKALAWTFVLALITSTAATANAAPETPQRPSDCPQRFLALWLWNRQAALADMPKQPCLLYGEHDRYVCDQNGCTAYLGP